MMIDGSEFVYTFATLRKIVQEHDKIEGDPKKMKDPIVNFKRPELIVTQRGSQIQNENRLFKYSVTAAAISEFVRLNRNFLKETARGGDIEFVVDGDNHTKLALEDTLNEFATNIDGEIIDYDDQFTQNSGLVYGIVVNRSQKRLGVYFRGTVGTGDILADLNFFHTTPNLLRSLRIQAEDDDDEDDKKRFVKLHMGFSSYLFDVRQDDAYQRTNFDRIVASLKDAYQKYPDYELNVCGHSLGGALANIFTFCVAQTQAQECELFQNVTVVTLASPVVGNPVYNKAFQILEQQGRIQHIRISNEGDIIPSQPLPGYTQNGVNLHLLSDNQKMDLEYRNTLPIYTQLSLEAIENHMFPEYRTRLSCKENEEILSQTIDEIYKTAGNFTK